MSAQIDLSVSGPAHKASGPSTRMAIFLSCAVCPGAGHFCQRRWILGALYLAAFVACLGLMLLTVIVPLMINLRIIMDFAEKGGSEIFRTISIAKVLAWFGLAILVYLAALVDVIVYARRQDRQRLDAGRDNLQAR